MDHDLAVGIKFAASAESRRRDGDAEEAERIARNGLTDEPDALAGRIALARALIDLRSEEEAQVQLGRALEEISGFIAELTKVSSQAEREGDDEPLDGLHASEVFDAIDVAETDREEVVDADRVAQDAMRDANLDSPELDEIEISPPFTTGTVAELLEQQGHADEAREVRSALAQKQEELPIAQEMETSSRDRILATLEKWLSNLRGGVR